MGLRTHFLVMLFAVLLIVFIIYRLASPFDFKSFTILAIFMIVIGIICKKCNSQKDYKKGVYFQTSHTY